MQFLHCPKSLWLARHKPEMIPQAAPDLGQELRRDQGYVVEAAIETWLAEVSGDATLDKQVVFELPSGAFARTDVLRRQTDGSVDLIEIKSSHSPSTSHLFDLAFQANLAQALGHQISGLFVAHINGDHTINNGTAPFILNDQTEAVRDLMPDVGRQIPLALEFLDQSQIDESSCTCVTLTRGNHCDSFAYLNPSVPKHSIYTLPGIKAGKIAQYREDGIVDLADVPLDGLSARQAKVVWSAQNQRPFIDREIIQSFVDALEFPLAFYDYEATQSPLPDLPDVNAGMQIPFQFSLHVLQANGRLDHHEYLAQAWQSPGPLIDALRSALPATGSVVSWNKGYENGRNRAMGGLYPQHADFLQDVTDRTVDLQDIFKLGYVDVAFDGRTSIKNVLPVMVPDLTYEGMPVANGTAAMAAFARMITLPQGAERDQLRADMLAYCGLDSFAMVRIYERVLEVLSESAGHQPS
ncbi:DUF2779 domain-containing protein [Algirhabdus cladophorae]|uniref:DUF2779 domain-containing protein n=1 Tax=Algirhabdus cladophorae TaxID=3377108 RepID=UPI003B845721